MRKLLLVCVIAAFGCGDPGDTELTYCDLYPDANACIPAYCNTEYGDPPSELLEGCPDLWEE
jgi:hypothetical protein